MNCYSCNIPLELLSAKGKSRNVILVQTHIIPEDILIPTCPKCGETYTNPKHELLLELSVRKNYNLPFSVLVLDDSIERHEWFSSKLRCDIKQAFNAKEAKDLIDQYVFQYIFLDHDLGEGNGTGMEVAEHLSEVSIEKRPLFTFIHSHNPVPAKHMRKLLGKRGFHCTDVPFGSWLESFIKEKYPFLMDYLTLPAWMVKLEDL